MKLRVGFILFFLASSLWGCVSVKPIPNLIYPRPIYPISRYPMASESAGVKPRSIRLLLAETSIPIRQNRQRETEDSH